MSVKSSNNGKAKSSTPALQGLFGSSARKTGLDADWNLVEPSVIWEAVRWIDYLGGAITFSTTRNNNAYVFKVYIGAPYEPVYFDGDAEGRERMSEWVSSLAQQIAEGI